MCIFCSAFKTSEWLSSCIISCCVTNDPKDLNNTVSEGEESRNSCTLHYKIPHWLQSRYVLGPRHLKVSWDSSCSWAHPVFLVGSSNCQAVRLRVSVLACLARGHRHVFAACGSFHQSKHVRRARENNSKMEITAFCNLITEVTSRHFCHILSAGRESPGLAHT